MVPRMSPLLLLLASVAAPDAAAAPWHGVLGVDWTPFGRADLAWIEADQLSGTLVADTDGALAPPLELHGGAFDAHNAVLGHMGLARVGTATASFDENGVLVSRSGEHALSLKLGVDYRRYLTPRVQPHGDVKADVAPFVQGGLYGVLPSAAQWDDALTEEEQAALDEAAGQAEARIGAVGGRIGGGAELCWDHGLCVGARGLVVVHRTQGIGSGFREVSTLVMLEPALTLDLGF